MKKRTVFLSIIVLAGISVSLISLLMTLASPGLTCQLRQTNCQGSEICVFSMFNYTNSHAGNCSYGNWKVCCQDPFVILTSYTQNSDCNPNDAGVLSLNQETNSHAEKYKETTYQYSVCLGSSSGSISCSYKSSCDADEVLLGSLNNYTNSHVSGYDYYPIKICCGYSTTPCAFNITSTNPPPATALGKTANATVNVKNEGDSSCYAYVECDFEDPTGGHHLATESCRQINGGNSYTFHPGTIVNEIGIWNVNYCSVNASFDSSCGTFLSHDVVFNIGTFEVAECFLPEDCPEPWQDCNSTNQCYDIRDECTGCKYYDWCDSGYEPGDPSKYCCKNAAGIMTECCVNNQTGSPDFGSPMANCSEPYAIRSLDVNATDHYCYNEDCDLTGRCIDANWRPHIPYDRC
jgi:hypothetical protein